MSIETERFPCQGNLHPEILQESKFNNEHLRKLIKVKVNKTYETMIFSKTSYSKKFLEQSLPKNIHEILTVQH